jgi:hypothetical protein
MMTKCDYELNPYEKLLYVILGFRKFLFLNSILLVKFFIQSVSDQVTVTPKNSRLN